MRDQTTGRLNPGPPWGFILIALGLVGLLGCAGSLVGAGEEDSVEAWMEYYQVPGVSVAVIKDFEIAYLEFYGVKSRTTMEPVTGQTLFQAASLSKSVSAATAVSLAADGIVSLDTEVNDYLTSWALPWNSLQETEKVTIRRLLSHTAGTTVSGFRGYRYTEPLPTLIQILNGEPPANSDRVVVTSVPGSEFRYSGGGYLVMEQAVLDVTGVQWCDLARERILVPLGMTHSTYEQPLPDSLRDTAPAGYYADGTPVPGGHHVYPEVAAAALWTTPADLALFLIEIQKALMDDSGAVLSQDDASVILTEVRRDYGLGFDLLTYDRQPFFGHQGANDGFRGGMIAHRRSGDGLVILTNSDRGSDLYRAVVELIGKREGWPGF